MIGRVLLSALLLLGAASGCGQRQSYRPDPEAVEIIGVVQVVSAGSASEAAIIEEYSSGSIYALVGELTSDLIEQYGQTVIVHGIPSEEGFHVSGDDYPVIMVLDYTMLDSYEGSGLD
jgi:hypothetical protein